MKQPYLNLALAALAMMGQTACGPSNQPTSEAQMNVASNAADSTQDDDAAKFLSRLLSANNLPQPLMDGAMKSLQEALASQVADTLVLNESTEGGHALCYRKEGKLLKVDEQIFGESFSNQTQWYLNENAPVFVYERICRYNRPINWDSSLMKENGDNEVYQPERSKIRETGYFFEQGKLVLKVAVSSGVFSSIDKALQSEETDLLNRLKPYISQ